MCLCALSASLSLSLSLPLLSLSSLGRTLRRAAPLSVLGTAAYSEGRRWNMRYRSLRVAVSSSRILRIKRLFSFATFSAFSFYTQRGGNGKGGRQGRAGMSEGVGGATTTTGRRGIGRGLESAVVNTLPAPFQDHIPNESTGNRKTSCE